MKGEKKKVGNKIPFKSWSVFWSGGIDFFNGNVEFR